MIPILYESTEVVFMKNMICRLPDCIRCDVTEERNGMYECEFEYPVDGLHFDEIKLGRIIVVEHDESGDTQPFDIYACKRPIDGRVTFNARHISYRQSGMTIAGTNINTLADAFTLILQEWPTSPFEYYTDMLSSGHVGAANGMPLTVREFLGGVEGSILDAYGGEYEWNGFNVHLWRARGEVKTFAIRYGVNLTDYSDEIDYSGIYNACLPYWAGTEENSQDTVIVKGSVVNSGIPSFDGHDHCAPLDLSSKFETKPTAAVLEAEARSYMRSNQTYLPRQSIKVSFVRMQGSAEYDQYKDLQKCKLCDVIPVIFPMYGVSGTFKVVKTVWNVLLEKYTEMELGTLSVTLADALGIKKG